MKTLKNKPQKLLIIGPNFFFHSNGLAAQTRPELIFHIINMSQDSSVSLSVMYLLPKLFALCYISAIILQYKHFHLALS